MAPPNFFWRRAGMLFGLPDVRDYADIKRLSPNKESRVAISSSAHRKIELAQNIDFSTRLPRIEFSHLLRNLRLPTTLPRA